MARPETGAMRFDGDWRGVFIRGDNAFGYAMNIKEILSEENPDIAKRIGRTSLEGLLELLLSSDERNEDVKTQQMKPYDECSADAVSS